MFWNPKTKFSFLEMSWEQEMLSIKQNRRILKVPLTFTMAKDLITTDALEDESDEETEEEYEDEELLESSIYYSDNAFSSDEDLEFNPWEDHVPIPFYQEDSDENEGLDNPAIYLASAETSIQKKDNPDLHLGPLIHDQQYNFHQVLRDYKDICAKSQTEIGRTNVIKHKILTKDALPIAQAPYRCKPKNRELLQNEDLKLEQQGLVRKSASPWASPVVIVEKKGGDKRLCVDYRKLNAVTKADSYPLPRIDDMMESFSSAN